MDSFLRRPGKKSRKIQPKNYSKLLEKYHIPNRTGLHILEVEFIWKKFLSLYFFDVPIALWTFIAGAESLVHSQGVGETWPKIMDTIWVCVIKFGELFRKNIDWEVIKVKWN